MKQKVFPNLWQALLLTLLSVVLVQALWGPLYLLGFHLRLPSIYFAIINCIFMLPMIALAYYLARRFQINLKKQWVLPTIRLVVLFALFAVSGKIVLQFLSRNSILESLFSGAPEVLLFRLPSVDIAVLVSMFGIVIIGPLAEELFFRGIILRQFLKQYTPLNAILLSSGLFAITHIVVAGFDVFILAVFAGGLFYGLVYYKTRSLCNTFLLHLFNNAIVYFVKCETLINSNAFYYWSIYGIAVAVLCLCIWYFTKRPLPKIELSEEKK